MSLLERAATAGPQSGFLSLPPGRHERLDTILRQVEEIVLPRKIEFCTDNRLIGSALVASGRIVTIVTGLPESGGPMAESCGDGGLAEWVAFLTSVASVAGQLELTLRSMPEDVAAGQVGFSASELRSELPSETSELRDAELPSNHENIVRLVGDEYLVFVADGPHTGVGTSVKDGRAVSGHLDREHVLAILNTWRDGPAQ